MRRTIAAAAAAVALVLGVGPLAAHGDAVAVRDVERDGSQVTFTVRLPIAPGSTAPKITASLDGQALTTTSSGGVGPTSTARTAVLVVDGSGSMQGASMTAAKNAALVYARTVAPDVRVGLVAFNDTVSVLTRPTLDRAALSAGISRLTAGGDTALYDAVTAAAKLAGPSGSLVVLSDGADNSSAATLNGATGIIRTVDVEADVVAFRTSQTELGPLRRIAAAGSGKVVTAADAVALASAFAAAAKAVPVDVAVRVTMPQGQVSAADLAVRADVGTAHYAVSVPAPASQDQPVATPSRPATGLDAGRGQAAASAVVVPPPPGWLRLPWLVAFVAAGVAIVAALAWPGGRTSASARRRRALDAYSVRRAGAGVWAAPDADGDGDGGEELSAPAAAVIGMSERIVEARGQTSAIALRLDRAALTLKPAEWVVLRVVAVFAGAAVLMLIISPRWLGVLLGLALGFFVPGAFLRHRQRRRTRAFADQLPDTLQLVASSLRSGFSLPQGLAAAHEHGSEPMAGELGRALAAARIGSPLEDELEAVADRMDNKDWRWAVMAIRIQRSVGGNLADVLTTTARTMRERAAMARQVRALSGEGRLSAYILITLPVVMGGWMFFTRREYLAPLWTTVPGVIMLVLAVIGLIIGWLWMKKIVKVEV